MSIKIGMSQCPGAEVGVIGDLPLENDLGDIAVGAGFVEKGVMVAGSVKIESLGRG